MYNKGTKGSKYNKDLNIKDIAKLIRKDIKTAIKEGKLPEMKTSVRINRYSGGQSLTIDIKEFKVGGFLNPEYIKAYHKNPHLAYTEYPPRYYPFVERALEDLERIANAYNYDNSDSMFDYFDVNYYTTIGINWEVEKEQREELTKKVVFPYNIPTPAQMGF